MKMATSFPFLQRRDTVKAWAIRGYDGMQVDMSDTVANSHCFQNTAAAEGAVPRSRQARVGKELAGMAVDLPLNVSSSVFLRVDEEHMMLWKALITGRPSPTLLQLC